MNLVWLLRSKQLVKRLLANKPDVADAAGGQRAAINHAADRVGARRMLARLAPASIGQVAALGQVERGALCGVVWHLELRSCINGLLHRLVALVVGVLAVFFGGEGVEPIGVLLNRDAADSAVIANRLDRGNPVTDRVLAVVRKRCHCRTPFLILLTLFRSRECSISHRWEFVNRFRGDFSTNFQRWENVVCGSRVVFAKSLPMSRPLPTYRRDELELLGEEERVQVWAR